MSELSPHVYESMEKLWSNLNERQLVMDTMDTFMSRFEPPLKRVWRQTNWDPLPLQEKLSYFTNWDDYRQARGWLTRPLTLADVLQLARAFPPWAFQRPK